MSHRIYTIPFASIYPLYIEKVEKKSRTKEEVIQVICWLTGYELSQLQSQIDAQVTLEQFFAQAPQPNPARKQITGVICGIRVEDIEDPLMQEIRYMDKLIDELARGKAMEKILRLKSE